MMTVYDLIQKYKNATEEEQRQTFVGSIWDLEDVDTVLLDTMGYAEDALDADVKADCLSRAIEDGDGDNKVRDLIEENLQEALNGARGCANGCVDNDDDEPTRHDGGDLKWDYDYGGLFKVDHYFDDLDWD